MAEANDIGIWENPAAASIMAIERYSEPNRR
jgi:hypothetical protein